MLSGKTLPVLFALTIAVIGGCVSTPHPNEQTVYYVLEYPSPVFSVTPPLSVVLQVERFQTAPFYQTQRMVYRESAFTRHTDAYNKWRVPPGDLVTHFLTRDFRQSGLFRGVSPVESLTAPTHILEGSVEQFYEHENPGHREAILGLSVTLLDANEPDISIAVVFQKNYTIKKQCAGRTPRAFAEAMSQAMESASRTMIADIHQVLSNTK